MGSATDYNQAYYGELTAGRENYWQFMPAPRMRIGKILAAMREIDRAVETVCDFGCGNGALLREIAGSFPDSTLHGIDLSPDQIEQNRQLNPEWRWEQADLTSDSYSYPFDGACDLAVSSEVIEHLDEPLRYLRNILNSLNPGGTLILTTQSGPVHETERHVGHVRHWASDEMTELLNAAGFRNARAYNCGFPFHDLSKWAANLNPERVIARFGQHEWGPFERATAAALRLLFRFNSSRRGFQLVATASR